MVDWARINALAKAGKFKEMTQEESTAFFDYIEKAVYLEKTEEKKKGWIRTQIYMFAFGSDWENLTTDQKLNAIQNHNDFKGQKQSIKEMYILIDEIDKIIESLPEKDRAFFREHWSPKKKPHLKAYNVISNLFLKGIWGYVKSKPE